MAKDLLFEIGTEEIPARFMKNALEQLKDNTRDMLREQRLDFDRVDTFGTPRRLTVMVGGLAERQQDLVEEVKGPARKVAFDETGEPTRAAAGFARGQGVDVSDLVVKETGQGEYIFAVVKKDGQAAVELLPALLTGLVGKLHFPKPMRWAYEEMRFARAIRWLVALFGDEVIELEIAGVRSGRVSRGHRFLGSDTVQLSRCAEYVKRMEEQYVIVDQQRRREEIWRQIQKLAAEENGVVAENEQLLEEVVYLLEYPTALCGSFEEKYLELPDEVLVTPMQEHQRYFPVRDESGRLLNKFITVRNGTAEHLDIVTAGNEKVLRARLADAEFFYREDIKEKLDSKVDALKDIVFQEQLGTVYEKVQRIMANAGYLADLLAAEYKQETLRTAYLAKADLVSHMVYEFPELQGIMGGYYAAHDGEAELVAAGIREHWQPRFAGDAVPGSITGVLVSIADKIDTIVGCFGIGIQPTGSQDPYALRRQAQGICHMLLDKKLELSVKKLVAQAYSQYAGRLSRSEEEVMENVLHFFEQRVETIFQDRGMRYDIVRAVLAAGWDNPLDAQQRAQALDAFRRQQQFEALATAFKRAANLVEKAETNSPVQQDLLREQAEQQLWQAIIEVEEKLAAVQGYLPALEAIAGLRRPVDDFFEQVMVMTDDRAVRENRLAILRHIRDLIVGKTGIRLELVN